MKEEEGVPAVGGIILKTAAFEGGLRFLGTQCASQNRKQSPG